MLSISHSLSQQQNRRACSAWGAFLFLLSLLCLGCEKRDAAAPASATPASVDVASRNSDASLNSDETEFNGSQDASSAARPPNTIGSPDSLMVSAIQAASESDYEAASKLLQKLLIRDPNNAKAIFLLARCEASTGDLDAALALLEDIPLTDPQFGVAALGQRAEFLSNANRPSQSIPLWKQLLDDDPDLHLARSGLAKDLTTLELRTEAGTQLQALAKAGVANQDQLRQLLNVTAPPMSRQQLSRLNRERTPMDGAGLSSPTKELRMAWQSIRKRRYRDAWEVLNSKGMQFMVNRIASDQVHSLRAWLSAELQQMEIATDLVHSAKPDCQRFPSFWLANGILWQQQGDMPQAIACLEEALRLDPSREVTHERLSGALLRDGQVIQAREIDERRFALTGPIEAEVAVGPGQPDDAAASKALVGDLIRLGRPFQAANWLRLVGMRNQDVFGDEAKIRSQIQSLRQSTQSEMRWSWNRGIPLANLPAPTSIASQVKPRSPDPGEATRAARWPKPNGKIVLSDVAGSAGIPFAYRNATQPKDRVLRLFEQLGGGVATFDYDLDGAIDLYFAQAGGDPPHRTSQYSDQLFRNVWPRFHDISERAGVRDRDYSLGVTYGDWNQDGFWDVFVGNFGRNRILINQGDGTFADQSNFIQEARGMMTTSLGVADLDGDNLPDLFEVNYVDDDSVLNQVPVTPDGFPADFIGPNKLRAAVDRVAFNSVTGVTHCNSISTPIVSRNEASGAASDSRLTWSDTAKVGDVAQPGLGLIIGRFNRNSGLSCFVANDLRPNQCWRLQASANDHNRFADFAGPLGLAVDFQGRTTACMGIALADLNRDEAFDLVVTNWYDQSSNLYQQVKPDRFVDRAAAYGLDRLSDHHVGFGVVANDFDNDGWQDLLVGNGHVDDFSHQGIPQRMRLQVLRNTGRTFAEQSPNTGYFKTPHLSRCLVSADLNRDGRTDAIVTDLIDQVAVLRNDTVNTNQWIQLQLVATQSERSAVGTRVRLENLKPSAIQTVLGATGYMGRNSPTLHFGIGSLPQESLEVNVDWASGNTELYRLTLNRCHLLVEGVR
ncbi:MAG: FG-GAP-like repeat-containing protein [Planctomycetota bacterium]